MFLETNLSSLFFGLLLFRQTPEFDDFIKNEKLFDAPIDFKRIRCPLCRWQPQKSSRWFCSDFDSHEGCGTSWNTFDTGGVCPGCFYSWRWTDCLRCHKSSPHEAWYQDAED